MKKAFFGILLLASVCVTLPVQGAASVDNRFELVETMTRAELNQVLVKCEKEFCMSLNALYVAYGNGDLTVQKIRTGVFSVELSGGGSILILLEDA